MQNSEKLSPMPSAVSSFSVINFHSGTFSMSMGWNTGRHFQDAKTIAYLIDKVREEQIPAVYYLELSSPRVAEIIGEETGAEPLLFHSCHNVTRHQFDSGVTYLELMEQNVKNLKKGLS